MYFQLVEPSPDPSGQPEAVIDCALFAGSRAPIVREFARRGLLFELTEGSEVRLEGRVSLWDKGGRYQFIVSRVDPDWAAGEQVAALRTLVDLFSKEDILSTNGELDMPVAPLRVGLITSRGSAACEDFLHGLRESGFPFEVFTAWAPMQGVETSRGVLDSFRNLLNVPDLDVVVLTRGGGSPSDLGWFNDEHIGRMISQLPWPVISGIGHETDTTLPDFVAHTRAKTPTHAADILVNTVAALLDDLTSLGHLLQRSTAVAVHREAARLAVVGGTMLRAAGTACRSRYRDLSTAAAWMKRHTESRITSARSSLNRLQALLFSSGKVDRTTNRERMLDELSRRLGNAVDSRLGTSSLLLDSMDAKVSARDPGRLYRSGWATVRNSEGAWVRSINDTGTNQYITVRLSDGSIGAVTEEITPLKKTGNVEINDGTWVPEGADDE